MLEQHEPRFLEVFGSIAQRVPGVYVFEHMGAFDEMQVAFLSLSEIEQKVAVKEDVYISIIEEMHFGPLVRLLNIFDGAHRTVFYIELVYKLLQACRNLFVAHISVFLAVLPVHVLRFERRISRNRVRNDDIIGALDDIGGDSPGIPYTKKWLHVIPVGSQVDDVALVVDTKNAFFWSEC